MLRVKIEESEKAGSHRESNPGHLWLEPPVLCHWATTAGQPPTLTILYIYCTGGTECLSRTHGSHSVCAVRTPLGVDRKILSIRKEPMLSGFLTLKAQSILPHTGNKWNWLLWGENRGKWKASSCRESTPTEVSWVQLPATASLFTILYFHLI